MPQKWGWQMPGWHIYYHPRGETVVMLFAQMLCSSIFFAQEAAGVAALLLQSQVLLHQESPLENLLQQRPLW